jgi:hypothetical protein
LDATQYFSSKSISCAHCLRTQESQKGRKKKQQNASACDCEVDLPKGESNNEKEDITYSHKVLQAGIMHPDRRQVIPLMPEEIRNTDGHSN